MNVLYMSCPSCTGGSDTESDDDNDKGGGVDVDTDDEDEVFFEAKETLKSSASARHASESPTHSHEGEVHMDSVGFDYPKVQRRKCLPDPKEKEKSVSLWSMIKDNIGKDLTKVCLPVYFNEPISSLQRCFEDVEYSYLLDRAAEYGKRVSFMCIWNLCEHVTLVDKWLAPKLESVDICCYKLLYQF